MIDNPPPKTPANGDHVQCLVRHLDLFSGIGGFALAAKWNGIKTVGFCEIEPFAKKVLTKNFPNITIHEDVRNTADFEQYRGTINLLTGGYPCQPFSVAGAQKAEDDPRHLWPSMREVIKLVRPNAVLAENVGGHINLGLDQVLGDLENEGYTARAIVIPACAVQAPHRRERVWIVAYTSRPNDRINPQGATGRQGAEFREGISFDAPYSRSQRGQGKLSKAFQGKPSLSWCEDCRRIEDWRGLPDLLQPLVSGGNNGIPHRVDRTRGIGNAIVPQVAEEIIRCMMLSGLLSNSNILES